MIPALGLIQIGRKRAFLVPLPVILLWPFVLLGWLVVSVGSRLARGDTARERRLQAARLGILALFHLSGLRVEARTADGETVRIRMY